MFAGTASASPPVIVTQVDGRTTEARLDSVDAASVVIGDEKLALDDVRWIEPAKAASEDAAMRPLRVWLEHGELRADDVHVAGDEVRIVRTNAEPWKLLLPAVRGGWWSAASPPSSFLEALSAPDREHDRLLLVVNGSPTLIDGYLEGLTAGQVRMEWMDELRTVPRNVCPGFIAARSPSDRPAKPRLAVQLRDGSTIPAATLTSSADTLMVHLAATQWSVRWAEVERIEVATDRLRFLSDLTPVTVQSETLVALPRPWQADKSVVGRPLRPGSSRPVKGLGMQSGTRLTFDVSDEDARQFAADLLLDPETGKNGDCVFVVRGDGRDLVRERVRGGDEPRAVRIPLDSVERLELAVEFGANLDLGDHAIWRDARLVKKGDR